MVQRHIPNHITKRLFIVNGILNGTLHLKKKENKTKERKKKKITLGISKKETSKIKRKMIF